MSLSQDQYPSFFSRFQREIRVTALIVALLAFFACYKLVGPVTRGVDAVVTPAVGGITVVYGKISSFLYRLTGVNLGFVTVPPDQEFLFSVRLATYVNDRRAGPLFDLAMDPLLSDDKRERALLAILKFESPSHWIQPFLNELSKGGLPGLYDEKTPVLDELIKQIRSAGGIKQPLVRAYAEVAFSFIMQLPDVPDRNNSRVRLNATRWVVDVLPEDAIFLIIGRIGKEQNKDAQLALEQALLNIRAVSDPVSAKELLLPHFKKPPWPGIRFPAGIVLARLGVDSAIEYVRKTEQSEDFDSDQRMMMRVALARTPYPRSIGAAEVDPVLVQRQKNREMQYRLALDKRQRFLREERMKQWAVAKAEREKRREERMAAAVAAKKAAADAAAEAAKAKPPVEVAEVPEEKKPDTQVAAVPTPQPPIKAVQPPVKPPVTIPPVKTAPTPKPAEPPQPKQAPKSFPPPGTETQVAPPPVAEVPHEDDLALLPPEPEMELPPPVEEIVPKKSKSLMNYIDAVFEVKGGDAPIYKGPGKEGNTGITLPVGMKGKADLEVMIGEEKWYQVKTKKGNGWVSGNNLMVFNLTPDGVEAVVPPPSAKKADEERKESTYFEANSEEVSYYSEASEKSKKIGILKIEVAYLAISSKKVGPDRWFQLQIKAGETGWVQGFDVQLAEVTQPAEMEIPTGPLSQRGKKSAFSAEWVSAAVKGVGVYNRPSIVGTMLLQINPADTYKVLDVSSGGGNEWYKIQLPGKKEGWVQTLDVKLMKAPSGQ